MSSDDEMYAENLGMSIVAKVFASEEEMMFEVYDRNGMCWAEGTAPTIEQAWDLAMGYIRAEWPRSLFK